MIDLKDLDVELLPARTTLTGGISQSATGGANGINALNNGNLIPVLSSVNQSGFGAAANSVG